MTPRAIQLYQILTIATIIVAIATIRLTAKPIQEEKRIQRSQRMKRFGGDSPNSSIASSLSTELTSNQSRTMPTMTNKKLRVSLNSSSSMMSSSSNEASRIKQSNNQQVFNNLPKSNYTVYYPLEANNNNNKNNNNNNDATVNKNETLIIHNEVVNQRPRRISSINGTIDLSQYDKSDVDRLYNDALLVYFKNFNDKLPSSRVVRRSGANSTSSASDNTPVFSSERRIG